MIKLRVFKPKKFRKEYEIDHVSDPIWKFGAKILNYLFAQFFTVEPTLICYSSYDCRTISNEKDVFKAKKKRLTNCAPSK